VTAPAPRASSPEALRRMKNTRRRDTDLEVVLRRLLFAKGLRFRIDEKVLPDFNRRADLVFAASRVAVFVDGCFWHYCPIHRTQPRANSAWWLAKLRTNRRRDLDTNRRLKKAGWSVARVWGHEPAATAAARIVKTVRARLRRARPR